VNLWQKYTFTGGALKGFYVGGGVNSLGKTYVHPSATVPIFSEPVVLFDALVGYATKLGNRPANFRLNVRNLLDKHYLNGTFQYGEPRTAIATLTLQF
jgi:iron complex outermembrane receptor protein